MCVDKLIKLICLLFAETRRPLVKILIKNDACTLLLHNLRAVADDRGLGHDISLQIHQILAVIGHHGLFLKKIVSYFENHSFDLDKRLALKARLFKTIGCTVSLFRTYSYNAKYSPVILTLLKIYAKNREI